MDARRGIDGPRLPSAAISALQSGHKIEAIKIVREERGIGLKEAKDAVEDYLRGEPTLLMTYDSARTEAGRHALRWLVPTLIALALLAYYFFA
jgi:hypothetical protein